MPKLKKLFPPLKKCFRGKRILISLGPTREYLDPVRFFSNASSGKMGLHIARRLRSYGARTFLVCGPGVYVPAGFRFSAVRSAREMCRQVQRHFIESDIFISAAAVSDYRPAKPQKKKIRKSKDTLWIEMVRNPDILSSVTKKKTKQFCVGFALEDTTHTDGLARALKKMKEKRCDLMVLNGPDSMESELTDAAILFPDGKVQRLGRVRKDICSEKLCRAMAQEIVKKKF